MKCPHCDKPVPIDLATIQEITRWFEHCYPQDIFKTHPVSWVRRLMKFLCGMDYHVLIDERTYTDWNKVEK